MPISLDIRTGVLTAVIVASVLAVFSLYFGIRGLVGARNTRFYRMRREQIVQGWRRILFGLMMVILAWSINTYAEPVAYSFFSPSPTPTITPTITLTPTISLTPSITETPSITPTPEKSHTPTITLTPGIPLAVEAQFEGSLVIPENAVFSTIEFTTEGWDALYRPIEPSGVFTNPIQTMYAVFTYDGMTNGVQWTALWYREGLLVNFETKPWDGDSGGSGFSDWSPRAEEWLPGQYQVQLFVGLDWLRVGNFTVIGIPPTPTSTPTRTPTDTPTPTATFTNSPIPTETYTPSRTPVPTQTDTGTPTYTATPGPTATDTPTRTPQPTRTHTVRPSPWPTQTRTPTPQPTDPEITPEIPAGGIQATATDTPTPTPTPQPTVTPSVTPTVSPTAAPLTPTITPSITPTRTPYMSPTNTRTSTPWPTVTPKDTSTPRVMVPTITPIPTITRWPTATQLTPIPTITRHPSPTPTLKPETSERYPLPNSPNLVWY